MPFFGSALRPALLLLATAATCAPAADFTWLGDLPGGVFESRAYAVSADGTVIVGASASADGNEAFRWEDGVMTGLGDLTGASPLRSVAYGVSADGSVIVGQSGDGPSPPYQAFRYAAGVMEGLGWLPDVPARQVSTARDVTPDGAVVVGSVGGRAATWTAATGWTAIAGLPGANPGSLATGISADGATVAGTVEDPDLPLTQPFVANAGGVTALGTLPTTESWPFALATGISADGTAVVGHSATITPTVMAFRWADGLMTGLGTLPRVADGHPNSHASAVSGDGSVVAGTADGLRPDGSFGPDIAFVWTPSTGMMRLWDYLYAQGVRGVSPRALAGAMAISDDGRTIVGHGPNAAGSTEAWRVRLDATPVTDADRDSVPDAFDNCLQRANPEQRDTDRDGFGNACDADLDGNGFVNAADLAIFRVNFGFDFDDADFDASYGIVNAADLAVFRQLFGKPPGPSGRVP